MAISITHPNQSPLADGGNPLLIQPSNWNENHVLELGENRLLGRTLSFPAAGEAVEISLAAYLTISGGTLTFAPTSTLEEITLATPLGISYGGHGGTSPQDALQNLELDLLGCVFHFPMTTPPTGFLKANGAAVSRETYARLFSKIGTTYGAGNGTTTFNVPDARGMFLRGWDNARGVDSGRVLGSDQLSSIKPHTHTFSGGVAGNGTHEHFTWSQSGRIGGAGASIDFIATTNRNDYGAQLTSFDGAHQHTWSGNTGNSGSGTDSRPRNWALLACVKY